MGARITILDFLMMVSLGVEGQVPTITSFTPTSGPVGTSVTISGANFNATPANNTVFFGAVKAVVSTASTTQLTVTVPSGATYAPISVLSNGLQAFSARPFTTTLTGGTAIFSGSFAAKSDFTAASNPWEVAVGDIDGDGKVDVITNDVGVGSTSIHLNTSSGTGALSFAAAATIPGGSGPHGTAVGDLNGDGKLDLAIAEGNTDNLRVVRNASSVGAISYSVDGTYSAGNDPYPPSIADIDGDGKPDVVVPNDLDHNVSVFRNTSTPGGSISMDSKVDFSAGALSFPTSVATGDLDGDGKPDVVVACTALSQVSALRNASSTGVISFAAKIDFATAVQARSVALGDLDGDGKLDMAVELNLR